jgi:predicted  nucleic acid-binding Zn-ribbon protein
MFGEEVDLDEADAGPSLEIDDARARRITAPPAEARRPSTAPATSRPSRAPAPPGQAPGPAPEHLAAAGQLAAYGECKSALQAPAYAIRVRRRQAELRRQIVRLEEAVLVSQGEAEEAMARIAMCIREMAADDASLAPLLEAVVRAEAQAKDRELAVIAADTSSAVLSDVVQQRIERVRKQMAPARAEIERLSPELRTKQEGHRRVMAQVRRSEIELRNLRDLANAKDTEASAQTDLARKTALNGHAAELRGRSPELEAVVSSHRATATEMEGPIGDLDHQMAQLRRQVGDGEAEIEKLQAGQKREAAELDRAKEERMRILDAARVTVRNRLADVARAAIQQHFAAEAIAPLMPDANALAERAAATIRELELYRGAVEVHDKSRVQQGLLMIGGAVAGVLAGLIALVATC